MGETDDKQTDKIRKLSSSTFRKLKWALIESDRSRGTTSGWGIRKISGKIRSEVGYECQGVSMQRAEEGHSG